MLNKLLIKQQFMLITGFFAIALVALAILSSVSISALTTVSAYIGGESHWSKAQRDAVFHLTQYTISKNPSDYELFNKFLVVNLGGKQARLELEKENTNFSIADEGFLRAKNNPDDIRAMGLFFKIFRNVSYLKTAISMWTHADEEITRLQLLAKNIHEKIQKKIMSRIDERSYLDQIANIQTSLTTLENQFSSTMEDSARWLRNELIIILFSTIILILILGSAISYLIIIRFTKSINVIRIGVSQIKNGDLSYQIPIPHKDELGELAHSFNQMTIGLKEKTHELGIERLKNINNSKLVALGEIAGGIAHEINTPLTIIKLTAESIESEILNKKINTESLVQALKRIDSTVQRISNIIKGLLKFSRDPTKDPLKRKNVNEILEETLIFCTEKMKGNNVKLEFIPASGELDINCRPSEISQVLINLINNSFDAIQSLADKWIHIEVTSSNNQAIISITDSGRGIPNETREKIFQPFFTTKEVGQGTGLGLSISKGILDTHKGKIEYDEHCANTRFNIVIPLASKSVETSL